MKNTQKKEITSKWPCPTMGESILHFIVNDGPIDARQMSQKMGLVKGATNYRSFSAFLSNTWKALGDGDTYKHYAGDLHGVLVRVREARHYVYDLNRAVLNRQLESVLSESKFTNYAPHYVFEKKDIVRHLYQSFKEIDRKIHIAGTNLLAREIKQDNQREETHWSNSIIDIAVSNTVSDFKRRFNATDRG